MTEIQLVPLETSDREQFIRDNQETFKYGALEEFGQRDDHFEEDGEIISHETISRSIDECTAFRIMQDNKPVGGVVIKTEYDHGELELLFVSPDVHSKGIGYAAWCEIETMHPEVTVWETITPYFEKRNIHFYVNRCGFCNRQKQSAWFLYLKNRNLYGFCRSFLYSLGKKASEAHI